MQTECSTKPSAFGRVEGRPVVAEFDGGALTSDAGGLLLGAADRRVDLVRRLAGCFRDAREPKARRALGGHAHRAARVRHRARLRRPERSRRASSRPADGGAGGQARGLAQRLRADGGQVDAQPAGTVARDRDPLPQDQPPPGGDRGPVRRSVPRGARKGGARAAGDRLDLDATDDPLHGHQEGRFFHGYYDCYCYLPLYVFCGRHLHGGRAEAVEHRRRRPERSRKSRGSSGGYGRGGPGRAFFCAPIPVSPAKR